MATWPIGDGLGGAGGTGVGAAVDALIPGKKQTVYRAPRASGSTRLSFAPVITPRTKGVAVALSFQTADCAPRATLAVALGAYGVGTPLGKWSTAGSVGDWRGHDRHPALF